jgi:hypothetical protein
MYEVKRVQGKVVGIKRLADGANIPIAPGNSDYHAFQKWNAAQPVPLDLGDQAWKPVRVLRPLADIAADIAALRPPDRERLLNHLAALLLLTNPSFAQNIGINVSGDQANP